MIGFRGFGWIRLMQSSLGRDHSWKKPLHEMMQSYPQGYWIEDSKRLISEPMGQVWVQFSLYILDYNVIIFDPCI